MIGTNTCGRASSWKFHTFNFYKPSRWDVTHQSILRKRSKASCRCFRNKTWRQTEQSVLDREFLTSSRSCFCHTMMRRWNWKRKFQWRIILRSIFLPFYQEFPINKVMSSNHQLLWLNLASKRFFRNFIFLGMFKKPNWVKRLRLMSLHWLTNEFSIWFRLFFIYQINSCLSRYIFLLHF